MNLFVTSNDAKASAEALDDKRVGKMLMEANQMLSLAIKEHQWIGDDVGPEKICWVDHVGPGKICAGYAHKNHPVSLWVRETRDNFVWTLGHALGLGNEWTHRFGTVHGSYARTEFITLWYETNKNCLPEGPLLPFQNSARNAGIGVDYTHLPVPESYREYLKDRWQTDVRPPVWTRRGPPEWLG